MLVARKTFLESFHSTVDVVEGWLNQHQRQALMPHNLRRNERALYQRILEGDPRECLERSEVQYRHQIVDPRYL